MNSSSFDDGISPPLARPEQLLITHISNMLNQLPEIWKKSTPKISLLFDKLNEKEKNHLIHLLLITSIVAHDFGKLAPAFQRKIRGEKLSRKERLLSRHIETSAIFARELFLQILAHHPLALSQEKKDYLAVIIYYTVLMHHQKVLRNLPDEGLDTDKIPQVKNQFSQIFTSYGQEKILELFRQLFSKVSFPINTYISFERINLALNTIKNNLDNEVFFEDIIDDVNDFYHKMGSENPENELVAEIFFLIEFNYSVLCDLDEWDAKFFKENQIKITIPFDEERNLYPKEIVEHYRTRKLVDWKKTIKEMADVRNFTFEAINNIDFDDLIGQIRTLTAPTGSAKTLALLNLGFKIRAIIAEKTGIIPKIIYCLPFITITEEVAEVVKEVLGLEKITLQSEKLTVHHHLAPIYWNLLENPDDETDYRRRSERDLFFTKLWRSDVIITTYVRFWESVLSCKKSEVLRFHRMANSIIIFDEMQAIPTMFWGIIYQALKNLAANYNCTIISATATQPLIIPPEEKRDLIDSHPDAIKHFSKINRYNLLYHQNVLEIDEFIGNVIIDELVNQPPKNLMIVLNTKRAAAHVSDILLSFITEKKLPFQVYFLSRNVLPIDRKKTLELIRSRLKEKNPEKKCLLVCTQLVEAGVNLSFEKVFRDMAPLSSIIQVAGRCNRAMEQKEKGIIHVFNLIKKKKDSKYYFSYAELIYDKIEINKTRELLMKGNEIDENIYHWDEVQLRELGKQYYKEIAKVKHTKHCLKYLKGLHFFTLNDEFKLIRELPEETLFIRRNDEAKKILERIQKQQKSLRKVKNIPHRFYEYILNIPKKDLLKISDKVKPFPNNKEPIFWVLQENTLYNPKWGFKT